MAINASYFARETNFRRRNRDKEEHSVRQIILVNILQFVILILSYIFFDRVLFLNKKFLFFPFTFFEQLK